MQNFPQTQGDFFTDNGNNEEQFRGGLCASHPDALDESIPLPTRHQRKFLQEKQFVRTAIDVLPDLRMPLPRSGSAHLRREIVSSYFDIKILPLFFLFFFFFHFYFLLPLLIPGEIIICSSKVIYSVLLFFSNDMVKFIIYSEIEV